MNMPTNDISCPECHHIASHHKNCSLRPEIHPSGTAKRIEDLQTEKKEQTSQALPIELLRQLVERHDIMDSAVQELHELQKAVWKLRKYLPASEAMTHLEVINRIGNILQNDLENDLAETLRRMQKE
jgi:hypothetical protein